MQKKLLELGLIATIVLAFSANVALFGCSHKHNGERCVKGAFHSHHGSQNDRLHQDRFGNTWR